MCKDCGCGITGDVGIGGQPSHKMAPVVKDHHHDHDEDHHHDHHAHGHQHEHHHEHGHTHQTVAVQKSLLEKNERLAERNRGFFKAKNLLVLNVLSSPGSGKTTLIQRTATALAGRLRLGVIVGDLATDNDAARLRTAGIPVVQITTGTVCHLDADMIARACGQLNLDEIDVLIIENVGNLVCPADYDLGEDLRIVLLSVTEGEDKPLKYPPIFHSANVAVVTKCDMALAAGFDRDKALGNLARVSHHARVFELSAKTGDGMTPWTDFLFQRHQAVKS